MNSQELDAIRATAAHWKEQAEQLQGELNTCKDDYIRVHGERNEALKRWAEIQRASALWQANYEKTAERWRDAEGRLVEAERLLGKARDALNKMPRSLAYNITHCREIDAFLRPADSTEGGA